VVDEHAVAAVREVERHVLVRLVARGAAVGVPRVDALPVLDERAEPLAEAEQVLADAQRELLVHEGAALRVAHHADAARRRAGQHPPLGLEVDAPGALRRHARGEPARAEQRDRLVVRRRHDLDVRRAVGELEGRSAVDAADVVLDPDADHVVHRARERHGDDRPVERVAARVLHGRRGVHREPVVRDLDVGHVARSQDLDARQVEPVAVGELHGRAAPFGAVT
jgi:hypothetical protein